MIWKHWLYRGALGQSLPGAHLLNAAGSGELKPWCRGRGDKNMNLLTSGVLEGPAHQSTLKGGPARRRGTRGARPRPGPPRPASLLQEARYEPAPHQPLRSAGLDLTRPGTHSPRRPQRQGGCTHFQQLVPDPFEVNSVPGASPRLQAAAPRPPPEPRAV